MPATFNGTANERALHIRGSVENRIRRSSCMIDAIKGNYNCAGMPRLDPARGSLPFSRARGSPTCATEHASVIL